MSVAMTIECSSFSPQAHIIIKHDKRVSALKMEGFSGTESQREYVRPSERGVEENICQSV